MIGIIVTATSEDSTFSNKIFHRFGGRNCLEIVIENALRCEYAQRVIVSMPSSDKTYITGSSFKNPVVDLTAFKSKRKPTFHFSDEKTEIERAYIAALDHGLDTVVLISADSPLLPTWLYSQMMIHYQSKNYNGYMHNKNLYQEGLTVEIMPFWLLANTYINNSNDHYRYILESGVEINQYDESIGLDNALPRVEFDLKLKRKEQIPQFDYILGELALGTDLGDLLQEMLNASA